MTTPLPVLPTLSAAAPGAGQNAIQDNSLVGSGENAFLSILQGLPQGGGGSQGALQVLRQLLSALGGVQGNTLPQRLNPAQFADLLKAAGPQLKAALAQALRQLDAETTASTPSAELLAMLQQLLKIPAAADAGGAAAPSTQAPGAAPATAASTILAQWAAVLAQEGAAPPAGHEAATPPLDANTQAGAAAGAAQQAPTGASVAAAPSLQPLVTQLLQAAAAASGADGVSAAAAPIDNAAGAGVINDLFAKLFASATGKDHTADAQTIAAGKALLAILGDRAPAAPGPGSAAPALYNPTLPAPPAAPVSAPVASPLAMPLPFNQQGWDQALGQNVLWMAKNDLQVASMRLNPPDLGPLEVRVSFNNDQATVSFVSQHTAVRDAVEAALPRLRDMFTDGGVNLANVNVSDQAPSGGGSSGFERQAPAFGAPQVAETGAAPLSRASAAAPLGLVDYFA